MGVQYILVNHTKKELVSFLHVPAGKMRELAGHPAASAITTWYLLENIGDSIAFVSDTYEDWPFPDGSREDLSKYLDATDRTLSSHVTNKILEIRGKSYVDIDEPEAVYELDIRNIWLNDTNGG